MEVWRRASRARAATATRALGRASGAGLPVPAPVPRLPRTRSGQAAGRSMPASELPGREPGAGGGRSQLASSRHVRLFLRKFAQFKAANQAGTMGTRHHRIGCTHSRGSRRRGTGRDAFVRGEIRVRAGRSCSRFSNSFLFFRVRAAGLRIK